MLPYLKNPIYQKLTEMQNIQRFRFPKPENKVRKKILPVFIPYQGCPNKCIYCAQVAQTGTEIHSLSRYYKELKGRLQKAYAEDHAPLELAFYGGTFTALPDNWAYKFLELANQFKEKGAISKIRCSTRPDALSFNMLQEYKDLGLDMVELGVQSFSEDVLAVSNRGYGRDTVISSCRLVKQAGMELGIQLLPGLPLHEREKWSQDVSRTIEQKPSLVRIYPCLTIKGTKLARWWEQGKYTPWSLAETLGLLTRGVFSLWRNNIKVNRIGLPPEKEMLDRLLAGPWHPSLGDIVQCRILYYLILTNRLILGSSRLKLFSPKKYQGLIWGYKAMNRQKLNTIGISPRNVVYWEKDYFQLQRDSL